MIWSWPNLRSYSGVCVRELKKIPFVTITILDIIYCPVFDLKRHLGK
jgi:hypothetical protein